MDWKIVTEVADANDADWENLSQRVLGSGVHPQRKHGFILSREALRLLLKTDINSLELESHGTLKNFPLLTLSLSHTKDAGAALIASGTDYRSVGIDIEPLTRVVKAETEERVSHPEDSVSGLELWCLKEAAYKCFMNSGLSPLSPKFSSFKISKDFWTQTTTGVTGNWELSTHKGLLVATASLKLLALLVLTTGCALISPKKPLKPSTPLALEQVTVHSPPTGEWYLMQQDLHNVVIAKKLKNKNDSLILSTKIYMVGPHKTSKEFLEYIARERLKGANDERFKVLKNETSFVTYKDLPCLKFKTVSEDHQNAGRDSKDFLYLKGEGHICRYPLEYAAIQIEASERSASPDWSEAAEFGQIEFVQGTIDRLKTIP